MSDELVWDTINPECFRAKSQVADGFYVVYLQPWNPRVLVAAFVERIGGSSFTGQQTDVYRSVHGDFDRARRYAESHHQKACRAQRWADHMLENEPPTSPETPTEEAS